MRIAEKEKVTNKVLRDGAQLCFCWKLCMRKSCVCERETGFLLSDDLFGFPCGPAVAYLAPHASNTLFSFKAISAFYCPTRTDHSFDGPPGCRER